MADYFEDQIEHAQIALGLATAIVSAKLIIRDNPAAASSYATAIDQISAKLTANLSAQIELLEQEETKMAGTNTVRLIEQLALQYKQELLE